MVELFLGKRSRRRSGDANRLPSSRAMQFTLFKPHVSVTGNGTPDELRLTPVALVIFSGEGLAQRSVFIFGSRW
ncbi:MAG: hypothetical protein JWM11_2618 [Planctomycetaceae bacterium]|nr:hypothetical protein [Planctomycetaceae bacterium]